MSAGSSQPQHDIAGRRTNSRCLPRPVSSPRCRTEPGISLLPDIRGIWDTPHPAATWGSPQGSSHHRFGTAQRQRMQGAGREPTPEPLPAACRWPLFPRISLKGAAPPSRPTRTAKKPPDRNRNNADSITPVLAQLACRPRKIRQANSQNQKAMREHCDTPGKAFRAWFCTEPEIAAWNCRRQVARRNGRIEKSTLCGFLWNQAPSLR